MSFADILILLNFGVLLIVTFVLWSAIKSTRVQVMAEVNRELSEVRRQLRSSLKSLDRIRDNVTDNYERIAKLEVNLASTQDELEFVSSRVQEMLNFEAASKKSGGDESEPVPDSERKHLFD